MALSIPSVPVLLVSGPLLFTLTLANAAESPTHAGRFQIVSGEVILSINDNDRREARVDDTLEPGVRVTTGDNSAALLPGVPRWADHLAAVEYFLPGYRISIYRDTQKAKQNRFLSV